MRISPTLGAMCLGFIDSHVHIWTSDCNGFPRLPAAAEPEPVDFTPEILLGIVQAAGVSRIVLVQVSFYGENNRYLLEAVRRYPLVFSGVPLIDHTAADAADRLRDLSAAGARGFRILPNTPPETWSGLPGMRRLWSQADQERLPICALINPKALPAVKRMCAQFPTTPLVIEHMGRIGMDGEIRDADVRALCDLAAFPETYVKVSAFHALGARQAPYLDLSGLVRRIFDAFGPQRMLWGSDAPAQLRSGHTYRGSLKLIRNDLHFLSAPDRDAILKTTAEGLFFPRPLPRGTEDIRS